MKTAVTKNSEEWKNDTEHAYRLHWSCSPQQVEKQGAHRRTGEKKKKMQTFQGWGKFTGTRRQVQSKILGAILQTSLSLSLDIYITSSYFECLHFLRTVSWCQGINLSLPRYRLEILESSLTEMCVCVLRVGRLRGVKTEMWPWRTRVPHGGF